MSSPWYISPENVEQHRLCHIVRIVTGGDLAGVHQHRTPVQRLRRDGQQDQGGQCNAWRAEQTVGSTLPYVHTHING